MSFGLSIYIQVLISLLVAESLKYSVVLQTLTFFSFFLGTSQVKMSPLMSSLTSEANSLHSDVEHYILSLKQKSKQTAHICFDEKVGKQM